MADEIRHRVCPARAVGGRANGAYYIRGIFWAIGGVMCAFVKNLGLSGLKPEW